MKINPKFVIGEEEKQGEEQMMPMGWRGSETTSFFHAAIMLWFLLQMPIFGS
jgi:hypothetical protein